MFDLAEKRLAWIPIRWKGVQAGPDGLAANTTHEIECHVELVDTERMKEIFTPAEDAPEMSETDKFKTLVQDWRKVALSGASAPMTDDNIALILKVPMFASGFEQSYLDAWTGQMEMREKNSASSSSDGRAAKRVVPATKIEA